MNIRAKIGFGLLGVAWLMMCVGWGAGSVTMIWMGQWVPAALLGVMCLAMLGCMFVAISGYDGH